jgi:hypothetical protein
MKGRNRITKFITMTIAVAAMAVIGSIGMPWHPAVANAQVALGDGSVRFISSSVGYVPGQTLRFNVVNSQAIRPDSARVVAHVKIFDGQGNVLAQSQDEAVPAGQFRSLDFNRDAIAAVGERGTGRLQVRAEIIVRYAGSPEPISRDSFLVSIEVFDTRSGVGSGGPYYTGSVTVSGDGF